MTLPPLDGLDLSEYRCSMCDAHGVKLFRPILADTLLCQECGAIRNEIRDSGLVAAMPAPLGTFLRGTSPGLPHAVDWWNSLPITPEP